MLVARRPNKRIEQTARRCTLRREAAKPQLIRNHVRRTGSLGGRVRRLWLVATLVLVVVLALPGCTPARQRLGSLEVRLTEAGPPGGANPVPPAGFDRFRCALEVTNTSESTVTVRYKDGQLVLYDAGRIAGGQQGGTSSDASTAGHALIEPSTTALPAGGTVTVVGDFLLKPSQRNLTLVYRLPGYPELKWNVR